VDKIRIFGLGTLAVWNFDREGNVSGFATSSAGGVILRRAPVTATYTLDSDCTGPLTFEAAQAHWDIVVTRDGREGAYIRVDDGTIATRYIKKRCRSCCRYRKISTIFRS
jgi:hypothetical protein